MTPPEHARHSLSVPAGDPVTVDYASADATAGNSATANQDYVPVSGTLTLPPGETEATIPVQVNGDVDNEFDETFTITLSNVSQNAELLDPHRQRRRDARLGPRAVLRVQPHR